MAEVETARLRLRRWRADDLDPLARVFADPAVWWFPLRRGLDRAETERFLRRDLRRWDSDGEGYWAAELKETGELIGYVGLGVPDWLPPVMPAVDVAWRLHPSFWGLGLASEGGAAAIAEGFGRPGVDRLLCLHEPANTASVKVADRLGFRLDRRIVVPELAEPVVVVRVLTREGWLARQAPATVRPACGADVEALVAAMGGRVFFEDRLWRQDRDLGLLFLAESGGTVVGDVYLSLEPAGEAPIATRLPGVPGLVHLEVAESHRRLGIATRLISAAESEARRRGAAAVYLGVEPANEGARRLYERLGYREWDHGLVPTGWLVDRDGRPFEYRTTVHVLVKDL